MTRATTPVAPSDPSPGQPRQPVCRGNLGGVLRVLATPRWVGWTLLAVVVVACCGGMAYWQLLRAESPTGSLLNAGYAFQWPLFGVFFAVLWWRMLRQEAQALAEMAEPADGPPTTEAARSATVIADEHHRPAPPDPSPFTARPDGMPPGGGDRSPAPGSARAEYNAMLAALAAADRAEQHSRHDPTGVRDITGTIEERARP